MIRLIRGQQGSTLLVAVITMSFLGIFIAGLLPFLSSVGKMGNLTQNQLQAAFAAEAGAKRALVSLARYAYDNSSTSAAWSWLGTSTAVLNDASAGSYTVTIQREGVGGNYIPAAGALIPSGNYAVTAAGVFNGITSTIYVVVPVGSDFQVDFKSLQWRKQNT